MTAGWRQAQLLPPDRALCAFAERLTAAPWWVTAQDVEALRAHGFSDAAIHDAVQVIAYFNYINRVADGIGTELEPEMPPKPALWRPPAFTCPEATGARDPDSVTLEEITKDNLARVLFLEVSPAQRWFVASNPVSLAQAHVDEKLWCRAIAAGGAPVGFVMLEPEPGGDALYIVRFMIDHRAQGRGYGAGAMRRIVEHARAQPGIRRITLSYVPGDGSPQPFYAGLGFVETGTVDADGERGMVLELGG